MDEFFLRSCHGLEKGGPRELPGVKVGRLARPVWVLNGAMCILFCREVGTGLKKGLSPILVAPYRAML